jgi:sugar O-acyltransferase (sialic acid O-acetyltransferase NeuD family)
MIFWGGAGHAKVLRECMQPQGIPLVALFDNRPDLASPFDDVPIFHGRDGLDTWLSDQAHPETVGFLVAIGGERGRDRVDLHQLLVQHRLTPLTATHFSAFVSTSASVGRGSQILAQAAVCTGVSLGQDVIVNTAASVDHECVVADGCHVCPGARLAGCVRLDPFVTVGTGAVVLPRVHIGEGAVVGAGAVVLQDVRPYDVIAGNPARTVNTRKPHGPAGAL